ncbi:PAS domain S-box protein [Pseudanabaena biceps]|nr:PAS domain S-box protein [Pseudanabaena biceps]
MSLEHLDHSPIAPNNPVTRIQPCNHNRIRIPLSLLLTVPFLLNTFVIVGIIGWLSFRNGHHAISLLASQLHRKATEQVQDRLHSYLELPYTLNQLNANSINLEQIEASDEERVQTQFWHQLQSFPHINNIYLATTSGAYLGARRINDKFAIENSTTTFATNNLGQSQTLLKARSPFNITDRSWYQSILETKQSIWTEVYTDSITNEPAITTIKPLYKSNGELRGVLGVSMLLGDVNQFLQTTKVSPSGKILIVEPSGKLVATSDPSVAISAQVNKSERFLAEQSQDPLTRTIAKWLNSQTIEGDSQIQQSSINFGGEEYFLQVGKLKDESEVIGLNWRIVVAVPASDFLFEIRENTISTGFLCLMALALNAVLGVIAARRISLPITEISQASQAIANGNLDQKVEYSCFVRELSVLANSFNQMSRQMKRSHTRLEEYSQLLVQKVDERTYALQQEIWQHELTESALRESEEKFAKAFQSSPDGMTLLSTETRKHIDVNDKWSEITGYSREEAIGANPSDLNLWVDLLKRDQMLAILDSEGRVSNYEAQFLTKSGKIITGLISSESIEFGEKIFAIYAIKDISDRKIIEENIKESEKKYRDLVESANCIILRWDTQGKICFLNDYGLKFFGYQAEEVIDKYVLDTIVSAKDVTGEDLQKMITEICHSPEKYQLNENENICKNGKRVWVTWSNKPIYNDQGELIEILSVGADITDRKQVEKELKSAKEIADMANRAKSEFLANMSHELRTPLNGILGYAQILKRSDNPQKHREGLEIIQRSGEHLLTLLNDILDLSKIEAKKLELNPSECDLNKLLQSIIDMFQLQMRAKDVQLIYQPVTTLPNVYGDEKRLRQVLINLLGNAVKFTDRGKVTLTVNAQPSRSQHYMIRFAIADTGVGIDLDKLEDIFQPFQQVGDRARRYSGTGLGLPICQKIVEMMGGQLHVESIVNGGSTFSFEIELAEVPNPTIAPTIDDSRAIIGYIGDRRKILIVDDKTENRLVLHDLLVPLGFIVAEAVDGYDCLKQAQVFTPDLILLDMVMPELDGHGTTTQLRQLPMFAKTAIIMVSASVFNQDRSLSIAVGCDDFIAKPINPDTLFQAIQSLLNLEWNYEEITISKFNQANRIKQNTDLPLVSPPSHTVDKLIQLARIGDILAIQDEVISLKAADPTFSPFANQVLDYARDFQIKRIREFLESQKIEVVLS